MMTLSNQTIRQKLLLLFMCFTCICAVGQSQSTNYCQEPQLEVYSDSLSRLLLAYQPGQVLKISDNLIFEYGHLDCSEVVRIKSSRANAYELMYKFEAALEIYNELLSIAIKNQLLEEEIAIRLSLARVHETIGRQELCLENLDKAKGLMKEHGLKKQLSRYYVRYSSYLRIYEKDKVKAKEYAANAVSLGKEDGVSRSIADGNLLLGVVTDDFDESIGYTQQASDLFFELGDYVGGMAQRMNIAKRYLKRGAYDKTIAIVNEVDAYSDGITNNDKVFYRFKKEIARVKTEIFERIGEKDSLIVSLKAYNEYSELFGFLVNQEHINQLLIDNAVREEQEKIEAAKKQNQLLLLGLVGLSGIILLLLRLYWLNSRAKNKIAEQAGTITNQYTELEKLYSYKSTLLSEVHHRIKNNLQLIISLLTLQQAKLNKDFDKEILNMLSHRINSIALIHEQLYALKEFDQVDVNLYIKDLFKNFHALIQEKNIKIEQQIDDIQLNLETITPLGLIWSELISNSLKYNADINDLKIYFDLVKKGDFYHMHYYDNGKGYPNGQFKSNKAGMGHTIINSLSRQLSGKSRSYNSDGAHFTLEFKEKTISPL